MRITLKNLVRTAQETLQLLNEPINADRQIFADYSENHIKHINTLCGEIVGFFSV